MDKGNPETPGKINICPICGHHTSVEELYILENRLRSWRQAKPKKWLSQEIITKTIASLEARIQFLKCQTEVE